MEKFPVSTKKEQALFALMESLGIHEDDIEEKFIRGSGKGGQKVNKTSSCVFLKHLPSSIEIKCQESRSRAMNRFTARRLLCKKIEEIQLGKKSSNQQKREKIKRQKRKRSKRAKEKMLAKKHHQSEKKASRAKVKPDN